MKPVLLDTCAIIYLFEDQSKLTNDTLEKINNSAIVLSISIAEIACKVKTGKLNLGKHSTKYLLNKLKQLQNLSILDISSDMWLDAIELNWKTHKDPADRLIVAFAKRQKIPIVTTDKAMKRFYKLCIA